MPNLTNPDIMKAFSVKTNDMMMPIYIASLIRAVTALHDLINNKLEFREAEKKLEEEENPTKPTEEVILLCTFYNLNNRKKSRMIRKIRKKKKKKNKLIVYKGILKLIRNK